MCAVIHRASADPAPSPPEEVLAEAEDVEMEFTAGERAKLRVALSNVLNDPKVVASRNRARSAMETYKAELREAVKRTSPELGEKVEKMLIERLAKSERDLLMIKYRSFFMPIKRMPQKLKSSSRKLFSKLNTDPMMEELRKASMKTQDVPERSKIFGAMRARIAEIIETHDPALFETLLPLPGTPPQP